MKKNILLILIVIPYIAYGVNDSGKLPVSVSGLGEIHISQSDITKKFKTFIDNKEPLTDTEVNALKDAYHFIIIPGFLTDFCHSISQWLPSFVAPNYNISFKKFLQQHEISFTDFIGYNKLDTLDNNVNGLITQIKKLSTEKKYIIVSHSKGCLITQRILLNDKNIREKTALVFYLQGPFMGTPLADIVLSQKFRLDLPGIKIICMKNLLNGIEKFVSSAPKACQSFKELGITETLRFMFEKEEDIKALNKRVPSIFIGSYGENTQPILNVYKSFLTIKNCKKIIESILLLLNDVKRLLKNPANNSFSEEIINKLYKLFVSDNTTPKPLVSFIFDNHGTHLKSEGANEHQQGLTNWIQSKQVQLNKVFPPYIKSLEEFLEKVNAHIIKINKLIQLKEGLPSDGVVPTFSEIPLKSLVESTRAKWVLLPNVNHTDMFLDDFLTKYDKKSAYKALLRASINLLYPCFSANHGLNA